MKPTILFTAIISGFMLLACNKKETEAAKPSANAQNNLSAMERKFPDNYPFSSFICVDSANRMLGSYLSSINADNNDSDIHFLVCNADSLRAYLSDTRIKNVKLMFAHTLEYINEGNYGKKAGYTNGNLTIIIAGYDVNGTYIYRNGNTVMEHFQACPVYCDDVIGAASSSLLSY